MRPPLRDTPTDATVGPQGQFAYLGPEGTFTERALRAVPEAAGARLLPAATAAEALALVRRGDVDAAMLPVSNTVAGPVPETLRALAEAPSPTVLREVVLGIEFALLVRPGTRLVQVRTVSGHPHAGTQVRGWLNSHIPQARWRPARSNAEGARQVRDGECDAAVAGEFTAAHYGLQVAVTGIQDASDTATRFLLCTGSDGRHTPAGAAATGSPSAVRTSLVGRLASRPEELGGVLNGLRHHAFLRAVTLHLAPDGGSGSVLLADCPGGMERPATARAVGLLRLWVPGLRCLGSYASIRRADGAGHDVSPYERSTRMQAKAMQTKTVQAKTTEAKTTEAKTTEASAERTPSDIARLREQIDAADRFLIDTLKQRLETSREIQRIRTAGGGPPVDSRRERAIRGRYAEELGEGGAGFADALLEMCRGRSPR
ncbi:chorismate mutase [Streptomyces sp. NPDC059875]|uniref:chorismate mutase n=1 Tax=unclassified Streptomyces TaxID=2593676 RepID=UPI00365D5402